MRAQLLLPLASRRRRQPRGESRARAAMCRRGVAAIALDPRLRGHGVGEPRLRKPALQTRRQPPPAPLRASPRAASEARCTRPRRATTRPAALAASEPRPGASQYGGRTTKKDKERLRLPTSGKEKAEPLNAPPKPKGEEKKGEEKKEEARGVGAADHHPLPYLEHAASGTASVTVHTFKPHRARAPATAAAGGGAGAGESE